MMRSFGGYACGKEGCISPPDADTLMCVLTTMVHDKTTLCGGSGYSCSWDNVVPIFSAPAVQCGMALGHVIVGER